jgi:hypothetical protein
MATQSRFLTVASFKAESESVVKQIEAAIAEVAKNDQWLQTHPPLIDWIYSRAELASKGLEHSIVECDNRQIAAETGRNPHWLPCRTLVKSDCLRGERETTVDGHLHGIAILN